LDGRFVVEGAKSCCGAADAGKLGVNFKGFFGHNIGLLGTHVSSPGNAIFITGLAAFFRGAPAGESVNGLICTFCTQS